MHPSLRDAHRDVSAKSVGYWNIAQLTAQFAPPLRHALKATRVAERVEKRGDVDRAGACGEGEVVAKAIEFALGGERATVHG